MPNNPSSPTKLLSTVMADPLLTSLCTICHISSPRYKCPRCGIRTCSASCIKKHKAWSECPGTRDPTAYRQPKSLKTAAGVDHDYNFLHGMEVSMQRAEKALVEDRGLVQRDELRPPTVREVKWKMGRDGRRRKIVTTRLLREVKGRRFEKNLAHRLRKLRIQVLCVPMGMERHLDNKTTFNRKTQKINWQVEWFSLQGKAEDGDETTTAPRDRILSKTLDDEPLYRAYHAALEEFDQAAHRQSRRQTRGPGHGVQNALTTTWFRGVASSQEPQTSCWITTDPAELSTPWPAELDKKLIENWDFYLANARQRSDETKMVTLVGAADRLCNLLAGTKVFEFPAIYVLRRGQKLPEGFMLGPKDTIYTPLGSKRKGEPQGKQDRLPVKRRKQGNGVGARGGDEEGLEDGEIASDGGEDGEDDDDASERGLELGEVLEEHSYGEDEDDEDDDTTSSSGSDSEDAE